MPDPDYWGTRTDILVANDSVWRKRFSGECEFWLFDMQGEWVEYFQSFNPDFPKPSVGLQALFCCEERGIDQVSVIGFDWFFSDAKESLGRNHMTWPHDVEAERRAMDSLELKVTNLAEVH